MTFHIVANLHQEAVWLGTGPLSGRAQRTISAYSAVLAALAPTDDVVVWTQTPVDETRLVAFPGWKPPQIRVGNPPASALHWADPTAKAVNDRRFSHQLAVALGCALPDARVLHSLPELETHLATEFASSASGGAWVCKAPWSSAGRERVHGDARELSPQLQSQLVRLFAYSERALVFEPWLSRIFDIAICGTISGAPKEVPLGGAPKEVPLGDAPKEVPLGGAVTLYPPHRLISSTRGGFVGIELRPPPLDPHEHDLLTATAHRAGSALAKRGYRGPFGIDAFVYRDGDQRHMHPLCEINARHTFGHVAHALAKRFGITGLRFSGPAPHGSTVFVKPDADDVASIWATSESLVSADR